MRVSGPLVGMWSAGVLACGNPADGTAMGGVPSARELESTEGENEVQTGRTEPAPTLDAGRYVLRLGELELVVDPNIGGRVTRFSRAGANILTGPEVVAGGEGSDHDMYGSTFWTSPQSTWGWPPEAAIDSAPQPASVDGAVLELSSEAGESTGFSVRKRFWADTARSLISVEYTLQNRRAQVPAAPWEISRVPRQGLVFFAARGEPLPQSSLPSTLRDGITWVDIAAAPAADSKLFQDGAEGWLAYVYRDLVFIKVFEDLSAGDAAPGEAEIEIFVSGKFEYAEIEQQGRYELPAAGSSSSWQVNWLLEPLPAGLDTRLGSAALVEWVRSRVANAR